MKIFIVTMDEESQIRAFKFLKKAKKWIEENGDCFSNSYWDTLWKLRDDPEAMRFPPFTIKEIEVDEGDVLK